MYDSGSRFHKGTLHEHEVFGRRHGFFRGPVGCGPSALPCFASLVRSLLRVWGRVGLELRANLKL